MQITAELRWFWNSSQPELKDWFCNSDAHGFSAGGGGKRIDSYLFDPRQVELGLKHRGGRNGVEIKGLVSVTTDGCITSPFDGDVELWTKWTSTTLLLDMTKTVTTEKQRWLRKFDTSHEVALEIRLDEKEYSLDKNSSPYRGCNVEITQVRFLSYPELEPIPDTTAWWTLSFESFGEIDTVHESLLMITDLMSKRRPPSFDKSCRASYPSWLSKYAPQALLLHSK